MRVRPAGPDDVAALARLNAEVQALHRAALPDHYLDPSLAELEGWLRRLLADPAVVLLLAEPSSPAGGDPLGFAVVRREASPATPFAPPRLRAIVDAIGVTATARRRGAGRALMAGAEELARSWSAAAVVLDVQGFNTDAERFYRALGYRPTKTRMSKPV